MMRINAVKAAKWAAEIDETVNPELYFASNPEKSKGKRRADSYKKPEKDHPLPRILLNSPTSALSASNDADNRKGKQRADSQDRFADDHNLPRLLPRPTNLAPRAIHEATNLTHNHPPTARTLPSALNETEDSNPPTTSRGLMLQNNSVRN